MNNHEKFDIQNRKIFKKKKTLQLVYKNYFNLIKENLEINSKKPILEIGSSGFIKNFIPNCITSNLVKNNKMIDKELNIFDLKKNKETFSNIVMIDIFHHLKFPMFALFNLHSALIKNGRVIMIEPAMGWIPRIIYKLFHHEPNGFDLKINWQDKTDLSFNKSDYFAAQALPWRGFVKKELEYSKFFNLKKINYFSDFAYLASGGFSFNSFYPEKLYPFIKKIDYILTRISKTIFAARMIIVLEKKD